MSLSRLAQMARERTEDRAAGRAERGLFTGRGADLDDDVTEAPRTARGAAREAEREKLRARVRRARRQHEEMAATDGSETDADDLLDDIDDAPDERERRPRPRTGAKRSVLGAIRQIPSYLRLLLGLMSDSRVSKVDRFVVLAAIGYVLSPLDFIPDVLPFLGQVDDIFLVMLSLQRLVDRAGRRVLLDHWSGHPRDVSDVNLAGIVAAAGFFLPGSIRRRLRGMTGGKRRRRD